MNDLKPQCESTAVDASTRQWRPRTFDDFLAELNHIIAAGKRDDSLLLFRGHCDSRWFLDSSFVRSCYHKLFGLAPGTRPSRHIRDSVEIHRVLLNLLLLKYGVLARPSAKLEELARTEGIDSWFELMKRHQQYPEEDPTPIKGSHLIDWTQSPDVGLFFSNWKRHGEGVLYVLDATGTGNTLQVVPVGEILDTMKEVGNRGESLGCPLLFYPSKQIRTERANNQQAVYVAQMDLLTPA